MATTSFGVNHPLAVKIWSRKLYQEALKKTWISKFIGTGSDSLIVKHTDLSKGPGDTIHYGLRMLLTGGGVEGDSTLEGNEEAMTFYRDSLVINQLRHAVRSEGKMSEQRVPYSVREEAMMGLSDWWADRMDNAFFVHACGIAAQTDTKYTGSQVATDPVAATDTDHFLLGLGQETAEASVVSASASNIMSLKYIDLAIEKAKTISPQIRPLRINGEDKYVMFLHPYQVTDMRTKLAATGETTWMELQKAAIQGGQISGNPIYTGALGEYNNTILHESTRIKTITAGTARAVFCGAQAFSIGFGQDSASGRMSYMEELFDYKNQLGVAAGLTWGMKAARFNSKDFGKIVVTTSFLSAGRTAVSTT